MKLNELMSVGDDNVVGRLIHDATLNLKKYHPKNNVVVDLLKILDNIDDNPNIVTDDGFSLNNYLTMLTKPVLDDQTLNLVYDALSSFQDSGSE